MDSAEERPIFVVGAPRSGTTLLRYMLCRHPRIYIPPESNFIPRFFGHQASAVLSPREATRILGEILRYRMFLRDWQGALPEPRNIVATLPDLTPGALLNALYAQYSSQFGAPRWGDKSPIYTSHLELISQLFPSAQVIHIIRDGRDVALSMLRSYRGPRFFYIDLCYAAHSWRRRVRQARSRADMLGPDRYYEVRYEHLVANPEKALSEICEYLGESYVAAMAEPQEIARESYHSKGIHAATQQPPSTQSSGRWRKQMSTEDQRVFQAIAGDLLKELGYETAILGGMSPGELARFVRMETKYFVIETGRRASQAAGIFHPTSLLTQWLKPTRPVNRLR